MHSASRTSRTSGRLLESLASSKPALPSRKSSLVTSAKAPSLSATETSTSSTYTFLHTTWTASAETCGRLSSAVRRRAYPATEGNWHRWRNRGGPGPPTCFSGGPWGALIYVIFFQNNTAEKCFCNLIS